MVCVSHWLKYTIIKYAILVLWIVVNAVVFWRTYMRYGRHPEFYYTRQLLGVSLCLSRAAAAVLNLNLAAILIPMCRTFVTVIRNVNLKLKLRTVRVLIDSSKGFHIYCAVLIYISATLHVVGHGFNAYGFSTNYNYQYPNVNALAYPEKVAWRIVIPNIQGVTGIIMCVILFFMIITGFKTIRVRFYNVFWYTHKFFLFMYILLIFHGYLGPLKKQVNLGKHTPGCNDTHNISLEGTSNSSAECSARPKFERLGVQTWKWLIGPFVLYILDLVWRIYKRTHPPKVLSINLLPGDVIRLEFEKPSTKFRIGQYVLLCCPDISSIEWHPFSITKIPSKPHPFVSVHVRSSGDWTNALFQLLRKKQTIDLFDDLSESVNILVDGPICGPMQDLEKYTNVVCVAGGMGITPFMSFIQDLGDQPEKHKKIEKVTLIWICRDMMNFHWFSTVLFETTNRMCLQNRPNVLDIQFYCTREHKKIADGIPDLFSFAQSLLCTDPTSEQEFVRRHLRYGRPNLKEILTSETLTQRKDTGVFSCGPHPLIDSIRHVQRSSQKYTKSFVFYDETF